MLPIVCGFGFMSVGYWPRTKTRWTTTCSVLVGSIAFHGWALSLLILIAKAYPLGPGGFGPQDTTVVSVFLLPGKSGAGDGFDTTVSGSESTGIVELDASTGTSGVQSRKKLIAVAETDPQAVFNGDERTALSNSAEASDVFSSEKADRPVVKTVVQTAAIKSLATPINPLATGEEDSAGDTSDSDMDSDGTPGGPNGARKGAGGSSGGGQTAFFGITAPAKRIVYVIDASESMRNHKAMELAKRELLNSLKGLSPTSQFQIIFFNQQNYRIELGGTGNKLFLASPTNLRHARQLISGIDPCCGTDRMAALTEALNLKPDVIYLLTDADPPEMSAQDLWDVRRKNQRKTAIHIVEFAVSADLGTDSFLRKLARQNGGRHVYRDLSR